MSLIVKGVKLVMTAKDILEELKIARPHKGRSTSRKTSFTGLSREEMKIVTILQDQHVHFDELVRKTGFSSSQLGILLSLLEVNGISKGLDGGMQV